MSAPYQVPPAAYPAPGPAQQPARPSRLPAVLTAVGLAFAALGLLLIAVMPRLKSHPAEEPIPAAPPTTVADLADGPFTVPPSAGASASASAGASAGADASPTPDAGKPQRRSVPSRSLVGPTYPSPDGLYTMALTNIPFAFLTPKSWGCLGAKANVPGTAWRCIDEQYGAGRPQIDLVVRRCADRCQEAERTETDKVFESPKFKTVSATTRYAERTVDGRYTLTIDHVFALGGGAQWLLVAEASAKPADTATIQRIINDMYSQAS